MSATSSDLRYDAEGVLWGCWANALNPRLSRRDGDSWDEEVVGSLDDPCEDGLDENCQSLINSCAIHPTNPPRAAYLHATAVDDDGRETYYIGARGADLQEVALPDELQFAQTSLVGFGWGGEAAVLVSDNSALYYATTATSGRLVAADVRSFETNGTSSAIAFASPEGDLSIIGDEAGFEVSGPLFSVPSGEHHDVAVSRTTPVVATQQSDTVTVQTADDSTDIEIGPDAQLQLLTAAEDLVWIVYSTEEGIVVRSVPLE